MPLVRVSALAGKSSPETKKKICQEIHEVMKRYTSAPDEAIWVVIDEVPADGLAALETASRYHLPHVAAAGLALVLSERAGRLALIAAALFLASVVCFSGSIYVAVLTGVKIPIAPIGGIGFMIGWLLLGISGWRAASRL